MGIVEVLADIALATALIAPQCRRSLPQVAKQLRRSDAVRRMPLKSEPDLDYAEGRKFWCRHDPGRESAGRSRGEIGKQSRRKGNPNYGAVKHVG